LQAAAADQLLQITTSLEATIDGIPLANPRAYRAQSPVFSYWLTSDNLPNFESGFANNAGLKFPLVSDGYWVMIKPPAAGTHTVHFSVTGPGFALDVTYLLFIVPNEGQF